MTTRRPRTATANDAGSTLADPGLDENLRLRADSPAIDAGAAIDAGPLDIDGEPRVQGSGIDIGADEAVVSGAAQIRVIRSIRPIRDASSSHYRRHPNRRERGSLQLCRVEFDDALSGSADLVDDADDADQNQLQIRSATSALSAKSALLLPGVPNSPDIPRALPAFTEMSKSEVVGRILGSLGQWLPVASKPSRELRQVEAWALFRFTGFGTSKIARLLETTVAEVDEAIRSVRALREKERAWRRAIWNAEWSLRWSLAAAPWRE